MFKEYDREIKEILEGNDPNISWDRAKQRHTRMIAYIQHERLIHLLVTIFVGLVMVLCCVATIVFEKVILLVLDFPLIILFVAYIFYYRFLENTTQGWYRVEDEFWEQPH